MKFDEQGTATIQAYLDNPADQTSVCNLGSLYWSYLIDSLGDLIHNGEDIAPFLQENMDFINNGCLEEIAQVSNDPFPQIHLSSQQQYRHLKTFIPTTWLQDLLWRANSGDKKTILKDEIRQCEIQASMFNSEIISLQKERLEFLLKRFTIRADKSTLALIKNLTEIDRLTYQDLQNKKEVARGTFLPVDERRKMVARSNLLMEKNRLKDKLFSLLGSSKEKTLLRNYGTKVLELIEKKIENEEKMRKKQSQLSTLKDDNCTVSPGEIENRLRRELEYLRDLVKLSAKRLHMESCSVFRPGTPFFTLDEAYECFDRILEFDPRLFQNDRVLIFGKPSILIYPGNGNGLYDWKHNRFIIPLFPPNGDCMASVANAAIEYRLDVDIDKRLISSYQKLPEQKHIRSTVALRTNLTRDYIKWMTSEYQGFKVLSKNSRFWFEHEIAPSRNDIFCPPEYQPFILGREAFQSLLNDIESRLSGQSESSQNADLWVASILNFQQGNFKETFNLLNELLKSNPNYIFGYYNLGIVGIKISQKQMAIKGFREFIKRKPQSWWASVANEHLRRLQTN